MPNKDNASIGSACAGQESLSQPIIPSLPSTPAMLLLFSCLNQVGAFVPLIVLRGIYVEMYEQLGLDESTSATTAFESALLELRQRGKLRCDEIRRPHREQPDVFLRTPQVLAQELESFSPQPNFDRTMCLRICVRRVIDLVTNSHIVPEYDPTWIGKIVDGCSEISEPSIILEFAEVLLNRNGPFRRYAPPEKLGLFARLAFSTVSAATDKDRKIYFGLVWGESLFRLGHLDESESVFRKCESLTPPAARALQVLRALGQIEHRRGRYLEALLLYSDACGHVHDAPKEYVATLHHHIAKSLFRLGRYDEAERRLKEEIEIRIESGQGVAVLRARHELARIAQARGQFHEAKKEYLLILDGFIAEGDPRLLPAPLYQLALLHLERREIEEARRYHKQLSEVVDSSDDMLWKTLSTLALAMIEFECGGHAPAIEKFRTVLRASNTLRLRQVQEDVSDWVRKQIVRSSSSVSDGTRAANLGLLALAVNEHLSPDKAEKASRYSRQPDRIQSIAVEFRSNSKLRTMRWTHGQWSCDCQYYQDKHICSHLVALALMDLSTWSPLIAGSESK